MKWFRTLLTSPIVKFLDLAQDRLLSTFGDHNLGAMAGGIAVLLVSALSFACLARRTVALDSRLVKASVGGAFVMYLGSFFATTFLEEEHEIWFFFAATGTLLVVLR